MVTAAARTGGLAPDVKGKLVSGKMCSELKTLHSGKRNASQLHPTHIIDTL